MRRAVGYLRLSKTSEESTSIARQREAVQAACRAKGWDLVDVFVDDDTSATATGLNRPGLQAAKVALQSGRAEVLVVWRLDRLARSVGDFSRVIGTRLDEGDWGVEVASATEPLDTTSPMGRAMGQLLQVFAEMESATTSARVKSSVDHLVRNGRRAGGQVTFGWRNVPNPAGPGHVLALDPATAPLVREAVDRVLAGEALGAIATDWTERGVPIPQTKGTLGARRNRGWLPTSLGQLLRRPVLAGMTVHRGELLRGEDGLPLVDASTALVTPGERRDLLAALEARSAYTPRRGSGNVQALLAGLLECDGCAGRLSAHRPTDPKRPDRYYCRSRECMAAGTSVAVSMDRLDEYVTNVVLTAVGRLPITETLTSTMTADAVRTTFATYSSRRSMDTATDVPAAMHSRERQ
jgi:site-specific DNA recombinase